MGVCIGYSHDNALGEGKNILTEFKVMKIYISCGTELQIHVTAFIHWLTKCNKCELYVIYLGTFIISNVLLSFQGC